MLILIKMIIYVHKELYNLKSKLVTVKLSNFNKFSNRTELIRFCHGDPYPNFNEFFDFFCDIL